MAHNNNKTELVILSDSQPVGYNWQIQTTREYQNFDIIISIIN